jgi:hypothetical protein
MSERWFMTKRRGARCSKLPALALATLLASCDDEPPTGSNPTTTTTTAAASGTAFLRAASLAFDASTVDAVVSGSNGSETIPAISYPEVSNYIELAPGDYRVQFFPAGSRDAAVAETSVTLSADEAVTVALVGLSSFDVTVFEDDRIEGSGNAGLAMVNTIPDFPAALDAVVLNGPLLFQDVDYLDSTDSVEVIPGRYDFELRRGGTDEPVVTSTGHELASGGNYTLFAAGSLTRGDMQIVVASDVP